MEVWFVYLFIKDIRIVHLIYKIIKDFLIYVRNYNNISLKQLMYLFYNYDIKGFKNGGSNIISVC